MTVGQMIRRLQLFPENLPLCDEHGNEFCMAYYSNDELYSRDITTDEDDLYVAIA